MGELNPEKGGDEWCQSPLYIESDPAVLAVGDVGPESEYIEAHDFEPSGVDSASGGGMPETRLQRLADLGALEDCLRCPDNLLEISSWVSKALVNRATSPTRLDPGVIGGVEWPDPPLEPPLELPGVRTLRERSTVPVVEEVPDFGSFFDGWRDVFSSFSAVESTVLGTGRHGRFFASGLSGSSTVNDLWKGQGVLSKSRMWSSVSLKPAARTT